MLAISQMSATVQSIFYIVGVVLFIAAGIGFKMWNTLALT
jgi:hypothetical protein